MQTLVQIRELLYVVGTGRIFTFGVHAFDPFLRGFIVLVEDALNFVENESALEGHFGSLPANLRLNWRLLLLDG